MASCLSVGWERWRALPKDRWMQVYAQVVTGNCVANGSRAHDARVRARPEARREPETAHMARIKPLDEKTIPEGSRETWAAMHKKFGKVPNLFATFAHSPPQFSGYIAFLSALDRGKLSAREIRVAQTRRLGRTVFFSRLAIRLELYACGRLIPRLPRS